MEKTVQSTKECDMFCFITGRNKCTLHSDLCSESSWRQIGTCEPSDLRDFLDSNERQKMEQEKRVYIQKMKQKLAQQQVGDIVVSCLFRTQNIN